MGELGTTDHQAAFGFYGELFGWKKVWQHDMGPIGTYLLFGPDEKTHLGGMFTRPKDAPAHPSWLYYVQISNLNAALARAKAKGAHVINGPMEVPGGAHIAQIRDPQGVVFCAASSSVCSERMRSQWFAGP